VTRTNNGGGGDDGHDDSGGGDGGGRNGDVAMVNDDDEDSSGDATVAGGSSHLSAANVDRVAADTDSNAAVVVDVGVDVTVCPHCSVPIRNANFTMHETRCVRERRRRETTALANAARAADDAAAAAMAAAAAAEKLKRDAYVCTAGACGGDDGNGNDIVDGGSSGSGDGSSVVGVIGVSMPAYARAKHDELQHTAVRCRCGIRLEAAPTRRHKAEECRYRLVQW
jgi:hypothetical protein